MNKYIFRLFGSNSVIKDLLESKLIGFLTCSIIHWVIFLFFWRIESAVEKALVIMGPWHSTELHPWQHIILKVLTSFNISDLYGAPIWTTSLNYISEVVSIFAKGSWKQRGSSIFRKSVWIHEDLCTFETICHRNIFIGDLVEYKLVLETSVVPEEVVISFLCRKPSFWIIDDVLQFVFDLISFITLAQNFLCNFVLSFNPFFGLWGVRIFHKSIRIRNLNLIFLHKKILVDSITSWSQMFGVLNGINLEFNLILIMVMPFTFLDTLNNLLFVLKHEIPALDILMASLPEFLKISRPLADPLFDESCLGVKGSTLLLRDELLGV